MSKTFEESMAAIGAKQIGESGVYSVPPGITAAYPPSEVGTLAKYFYRVESDGKSVTLGFQTKDELVEFFYREWGDTNKS